MNARGDVVDSAECFVEDWYTAQEPIPPDGYWGVATGEAPWCLDPVFTKAQAEELADMHNQENYDWNAIRSRAREMLNAETGRIDDQGANL